MELAAIRTHLSNSKCRLLTLVGPGGVGKTRLAARAAASNKGAFLHGVYFVRLAPVRSVEFVVPAIADALKLSLSDPADPRRALLDYLREKELLLVLDGFEHLLDGVRLLSEILGAAPTGCARMPLAARPAVGDRTVGRVGAGALVRGDRPRNRTQSRLSGNNAPRCPGEATQLASYVRAFLDAAFGGRARRGSKTIRDSRAAHS